MMLWCGKGSVLLRLALTLFPDHAAASRKSEYKSVDSVEESFPSGRSAVSSARCTLKELDFAEDELDLKFGIEFDVQLNSCLTCQWSVLWTEEMRKAMLEPEKTTNQKGNKVCHCEYNSHYWLPPTPATARPLISFHYGAAQHCSADQCREKYLKFGNAWLNYHKHMQKKSDSRQRSEFTLRGKELLEHQERYPAKGHCVEGTAVAGLKLPPVARLLSEAAKWQLPGTEAGDGDGGKQPLTVELGMKDLVVHSWMTEESWGQEMSCKDPAIHAFLETQSDFGDLGTMCEDESNFFRLKPCKAPHEAPITDPVEMLMLCWIPTIADRQVMKSEEQFSYDLNGDWGVETNLEDLCGGDGHDACEVIKKLAPAPIESFQLKPCVSHRTGKHVEYVPSIFASCGPPEYGKSISVKVATAKFLSDRWSGDIAVGPSDAAGGDAEAWQTLRGQYPSVEDATVIRLRPCQLPDGQVVESLHDVLGNCGTPREDQLQVVQVQKRYQKDVDSHLYDVRKGEDIPSRIKKLLQGQDVVVTFRLKRCGRKEPGDDVVGLRKIVETCGVPTWDELEVVKVKAKYQDDFDDKVYDASNEDIPQQILALWPDIAKFRLKRCSRSIPREHVDASLQVILDECGVPSEADLDVIEVRAKYEEDFGDKVYDLRTEEVPFEIDRKVVALGFRLKTCRGRRGSVVEGLREIVSECGKPAAAQVEYVGAAYIAGEWSDELLCSKGACQQLLGPVALEKRLGELISVRFKPCKSVKGDLTVTELDKVLHYCGAGQLGKDWLPEKARVASLALLEGETLPAEQLKCQ